jgi:hypothetical protein
MGDQTKKIDQTKVTRMASNEMGSNCSDAAFDFFQDDPNPMDSQYQQGSSSENSAVSADDQDVVAFGPIKVKLRKKPAPTLATGRRSRYEILTPDEEKKRDIRRARNRAAAERVRLHRLGIEEDLKGEIEQLQAQEDQLHTDVQHLQYRKLELQQKLIEPYSCRSHQIRCDQTPFAGNRTSHNFQMADSGLDAIFGCSTMSPADFTDLTMNNTPSYPMNDGDIDLLFMDY